MNASTPVDRRTVGHLARGVPLLVASTTCAALAELFARQPELPAHVIRRDDGSFDLVDRGTFLPSYLAGYNRDLFQHTPIARFWTTRTLVVSAETQTEHVGLLMTRDHPELLNSGFVITRDGDFLGIGLSIDLMRTIAVIAEESNLAKNTFLANMNHELRTPLNAVIGNLELLALSPLDAEQHELARMARVSADALLELIGDLLDLSKIQANRLELELAETSVFQLVDEVLTIAGPRARQKGLRLGWRAGADVPATIVADRLRLRQVLVNFVGNAVKFTEAGGVFLTVTSATGSARGELRFEVCDTGPGFDPARADDLFEPFVQEDLSTTRRFGGTGLGLAISKSIIGQMGGAVGCGAEPGLGATFWCTLPRADTGQAITIAPDLAGRRVAVAGPDDVRAAIARRMADLGADVAHLAAHAAFPADAAPDLVVVGCGPGEDHQVVERVAALSRSGAPVVVAAEAPSAALPYRARRAGADHVVALPGEVDEIARIALQERAAGSRHVAAQPVALAPFAGGSILVIDDTLTNRELAARQLRSLGLESVTAANGADGLRLAEQGGHLAILVDASMPVMDGGEFIRRWRAIEATRGGARVPVIVVTAHALAGDAERLLAIGADDYLSKPVTLARLHATLRKWLGGAAAVPPAAAPRDVVPEPPAIDLAALADMIGESDPASLRDLLGIFVDDVRTLLAALVRASGNGDRIELARVAHAAKSAAGSAGALPLAHLLGEIERFAPDAALAGLERSVVAAVAEFARIEAELARRFAAEPAGG